MDIQFMLIEDKKKMEIYNNGRVVTDYPLVPSEIHLLKEEGVIGSMDRELVLQICGADYLRIIEDAIKIGESNNDAALFEFPQEN
jgi:hypothetical protein